MAFPPENVLLILQSSLRMFTDFLIVLSYSSDFDHFHQLPKSMPSFGFFLSNILLEFQAKLLKSHHSVCLVLYLAPKWVTKTIL